MSGDPGGGAAADRIVPKPWGQERIWAQTDRYVGKVITINAGNRLSLQMHRLKDEWVLIQRGHLSLHHGPALDAMAVDVLGPGMQRHIPVGLIHRFEATDEDVELIEISTPELDDVVRLEDDYGREGTNAP